VRLRAILSYVLRNSRAIKRGTRRDEKYKKNKN
jgi:hypothetical protein